MLVRLVDFLKSRKITALFTSLTSDQQNPEKTEVGISSLMDTWLLLRNLEMQRRAQSRPVCFKIPRHAALQSDPRIHLDQSRRAIAGSLRGSRRRV